MKKKINKILLFKRLSKLMILVLAFSLIVLIGFQVKENSPVIKAAARLYTPSQYELTEIDVTEDSSINLSTLYTLSFSGNDYDLDYVPNYQSLVSTGVSGGTKDILISTANELFAFSYLCNDNAVNNDFLSYNYKLVTNIDYSTCPLDFIPIAYNQTITGAGNTHKSFSGSFDGCGFEIKNLKLVKLIENEEVISKYNTIEFYSMFSYNRGTITNLGIVDASLVINTSSLSYLTDVSPLVGKNESGGVIDHCYIVDLRDPIDDAKSGIITAGGFLISGFVSTNEGVFTNSYAAYNILCNFSITDYVSMSEVVITSTGVLNNVYYYNGTIKTLEVLPSGKEKLTYDRNLVANYDPEARPHYAGAIRMSSIEELSNTVSSGSEWYTKESYTGRVTSRIYDSFEVTTPILRGINTSINSENSNITDIYIDSMNDFIYAFELIRTKTVFASDGCRYVLRCDLDLTIIPKELYQYSQAFDATISGAEIAPANKKISLKNIKGVTSLLPTIYNARVDSTTLVDGVECYGFIPWLTGKIEKVNFYYNNVDYINYTENITKKAIGLVSGYLEGGEISNVNVFGNITINQNIGKYYLGMVSGIAKDRAVLHDITTTGSINCMTNYQAFEDNGELSYDTGLSVGGVIGYTTSSVGNCYRLLNACNIIGTSFNTNTNLNNYIGGVIGSGYVERATDLTNKGSITVGTSTYRNVGNCYIGGVFGKLFGINEQIEVWYNQGNITLNGGTSNIYVAGVSNVKLITSSTGNLEASKLKNSKGKVLFFASSMTNASDYSIDILNNNNLYLTGVMNVITSNSNPYLSEITGVYNLNYKYVYNSYIEAKAEIGEEEIVVNMINSYAPCIRSFSSSLDSKLTLSKAYNLKGINYRTTANVTTNNLLYSGCVLGKYIQYSDVRNEGDLDFNITSTIGAQASRTNIKVAGVFEEVSSGCLANDIFNGGDISFNTNQYVYGDTIINGICIYNKNNELIDINKYNPIYENEYDNSYVGSINNAINNGDITCTNQNFASIKYTATVRKSNNTQQSIATDWTPTQADVTNYFLGNISVAGITYVNESVISNTFNLGDIFAANYINDNANVLEINASGISTFNIGNKAYIINSANNGIIKAINLSTSQNSNVNASGITVRNDKLENSNNYIAGSNHSKQMICFTINYGSVYSYNHCDNIRSSSQEARTKSAGILAMGLCNIINTVNYGSIYGSETSSGIFGIVYFEKFASEVDSNNKIYISNSINYGNVYVLDKGTNDHVSYANPTEENGHVVGYNKFVGFNDETVLQNARVEILLEEGKNYFIGSIFSLVNFNGDLRANNVSIRFLISFLENVNIVGAEASTPEDVTIDVNNIYSAYYQYKDGNNLFDYYMGKKVVYSPLSTSSTNINGVSYTGVFSEEFPFRQAIEEGIGLSEENITDRFISDYFQFVAYSKINENLLDKIGWRAIAYNTAANDFGKSIDKMIIFLNHYSNITGNNYSTIKNSALDTETWSTRTNNELLQETVRLLLADDDLISLQAIIDYLFDENNPNVDMIQSDLKEDIINILLNSDENLLSSIDLTSLINGYSSILSSFVTDLKTNEVKTYLFNYFNSESFNNASLRSLLDNYLTMLETNTSTYGLSSYYNSISEDDKYNVLLQLFDIVNDEQFYLNIINELSLESKSLVNSIVLGEQSISSIYNNLTNEENKELYIGIILGNSNSKIDAYFNAFDEEIRLYNYLAKSGYDVSSFEDIITYAKITENNQNDEFVISERVDLFNQIRLTDTFRSFLASKIGANVYYGLATEYNNTFQSTTKPSPNGSNTGELEYAYTSEVTPSAYFYGPYQEDGTAGCGKTINKDATTLDAASQQNGYQPLFISKNEAEMIELRNSGLINDYYPFFYEYGAPGSNNQLCGTEHFTKANNIQCRNAAVNGYYPSDFSGTSLVDDRDIILTDDDGREFNARGGAVSTYYQTTYHNAVSNTNTSYTGYFIVVDNNNMQHILTRSNSSVGEIGTIKQWASLIMNYGIVYYVAIPTAELHSTQYTGVYMYAERWPNISAYYTRKGNDTKVFTTQYINYNVDQLLQLDGILTQFNEYTASASEERTIINDLFNTYCVNDASFQTVLRKALLESLSNNIEFIDNFVETNSTTSLKVNSTFPFDYLNYNSNTVNQYFNGLSTSVQNKSKLLLAAARYSSVYADLVNTILNTSPLEEVDLVTGTLTTTEITNLSNNGLQDKVIDDNTFSPNENITNAKRKISVATFNTKNYYYGLYGDININVPAQSSGILIVAKSSSPTAVSLRTGATNLGNVTVNKEIGNYSINYTSRGAGTFVLSVPENVSIYEISYLTNQTSNQNKTINSSTIVLPTENEILTGSYGISGNNPEINTITAVFTFRHSNSAYYYPGLTYNGETIYQSNSRIRNNGRTSSSSISLKNNDVNRLGETWYVYGGKSTTTTDYSVRTGLTCTTIAYTISYRTRTTLYENNATISETISFYTFSSLNEHFRVQSINNAINSFNNDNEFIINNIIFLLPLNVINALNNNEFKTALVKSSNEVLMSYIDQIDDRNTLLLIIESFAKNGYRFFNDIINSIELSFDANDELLLTASYLASDYQRVYEQSLENEGVTVSQTILKNLLNTLSSDINYLGTQYINPDGSFNYEKFDQLVIKLSIDLATDGYGIYALSSNKGILNGEFIPDNFPLAELDTNYVIDNEANYIELVEDNLENISSSWRGGSSVEDAVSGTVSYAILGEMKQLKLSISTTVFELVLEDENNTLIKSSEELIDLDNRRIIYYIPTTFDQSTFTYNSSVLANEAIIDTTGFEITADENQVDGVSSTVKVSAQDRTVIAIYTVTIYCVDMLYDATITGNDEIDYTGGTITISVTPKDGKRLPSGFDLKPYISIYKDDELQEDVFDFASDAYIDSLGNSTIILAVKSKLPFGENEVRISIFNEESLSTTLAFNKLPSTECSIIRFEYQGETLDLNPGNIYNSEVSYGYSFSNETYPNAKDRLESLENSYLSYLEYSDCATLSISASVTNNTTGVSTYTVTYTVTAEDVTVEPNVYTHIIREINPDTLPYVYKDGEAVNEAYDDLTHVVNVKFNRGIEPTYRVKYKMNDIYTENPSSSYECIINNETQTGLITAASYSGLSINITNEADPDTYSFNYVYKNSINWDDETVIEKRLIYPNVIIDKKYSKDALLSSLAFLESNQVLANTQTVMTPDYAIIFQNDEYTDNANEITYTTLHGSDVSQINVDVGSINYNNIGVDYSTSSNFYLVGSISNAQLTNYAPVFTINEYAEIYQYVTRKMIDNYGIGKQDNPASLLANKSDTSVLTTEYNDELFIYVPFTNQTTNLDELFMVNVVNGVWTNIYDTSLEYVTTYSDTFTINDVTYQKSIYSGTTDVLNNSSLYMDYIGTPLDNHFWYVNYVIFSEAFIMDYEDDGTEALKFFHVSTIDATNNVYFEITINTETDFDAESVFLTIVDAKYRFEEQDTPYFETVYMSSFAYDNGEGLYLFDSAFQTIPRGYFYFYLDLPAGYGCEFKVMNNRANTNDNPNEEGAYIPPSSFVTQKVVIEIEIVKIETGVIWAESTAEIFAIPALFTGLSE